MEEKKKKHTQNRLGTIPFTLLWTLAYGFGWAFLILGAIIFSRFFGEFFRIIPGVIQAMLAVSIPAFIYGIAQQALIRWKFSVNIRWWFLWSTLAAMAAILPIQILDWLNLPPLPISLNPMIVITLLFGYLFAIPAIAQGWLLREHIKRVWMWPLAAVASAATFGVPMVSLSFMFSNEFTFMAAMGIAGILQGSVMALTLIWLFGMTRVEPLKRGLTDGADEQIKQAENNLAQHEEEEDIPTAEPLVKTRMRQKFNE